MAKYNDKSVEALVNTIRVLNCDEEIKTIIQNIDELKGNNKVVDALLEYNLIFSICEVIDDEPLFDNDVIIGNIQTAVVDIISDEDNNTNAKNLIKELKQLVHMHYDYILFHLLGYYSEVMDIDLRDYTSSIVDHVNLNIETITHDKDEFYAAEALKLHRILDPEDEDYEFKKVIMESHVINLELAHVVFDLDKVEFKHKIYAN